MSSAGVMDGTFGAGGVKILDLGQVCEAPTAVAQDAAGRVLVGLNFGQDCDTAPNVALRLTASGSPDTTFSADGIAPLGTSGRWIARAIVPQTAGGIAVLSSLGDTDPEKYGERLSAAQLASDGSLEGTASAGVPSAVRDWSQHTFAVHSDGTIVGNASETVNSLEQLRLYRMTGCSRLTAAGGTCEGSSGGGGGAVPPMTLGVLLLGLWVRRRTR
jgi:hypothetical protein